MRDKCVFMTCCDTRQPPDTRGAHTGPSEKLYNHGLIKCVVYVKALLGAFNNFAKNCENCRKISLPPLLDTEQ